MRNTTLKTLAAAAALSLILAACGGGGGGGSSGNNSGGGTTTTGTNNGAALLAAYNPPAAIAAAVTTAYTGPAFTVGNSGLVSSCSNPALVGGTVIDAPDIVVFGANGASIKSLELAADLFENQAMPTVRSALGLPTTGVAFDGSNKVQLCVDTALGQGIGETGTAITGQTGLGLPNPSMPSPVMQIMSADSPNFDTRYPGATSLDVLVPLFTHETTHAALYSLEEPFGGGEVWWQEGMAQTVAGQSAGTKASVLAAVQASDVLAVGSTSNLDAYGAYESVVQYLTSSAAGGLGFGVSNMKTFVAAYKADATALCVQAIPAGLTPNANATAGMVSGLYNVCAPGAPGVVDARLETAFDQAFNATFKDSNGSPLYLHTADGANSLEATLYQRLNAFLN
ncbi:hypothetical protein DBB29_08555 [Pandoraea cepalis]|uniref:Uncharacterized protein n=1 Tax=Pandoraea cepalis TaxID=2508294 RepID=A0AAW7MLZ4_9BURK|nr:hypothetical protein [Pandoraea cepalis]MDN4573623.1 hypothetical protein [Pandoraea cepalis]MDN4578165.1 hypothetical protein [Pandoraea cepalis]